MLIAVRDANSARAWEILDEQAGTLTEAIHPKERRYCRKSSFLTSFLKRDGSVAASLDSKSGAGVNVTGPIENAVEVFAEANTQGSGK